MTTPHHHTARTSVVALHHDLKAEWIVAWLVLLAIALSILSSAHGHADAEGKAKNGVRRAATQLERKTIKGKRAPSVQIAQIWTR